MTQFNPDNKEIMTYHESLRPAMQITEQDDADQYFNHYVEYMRRQLPALTVLKRGMDAEQVCRMNLNYFCRYYDEETQDRVMMLFDCRYSLPK